MVKFGRNDHVIAVWNSFQIVIFVMLTMLLVYFSYTVAVTHGDILLRPPFYKMPDADFTNVWCAGAIARTHQLDVLYSSPLFEAWKEAHFRHAFGIGDWIYPPTILALGYVLSALSLPAAFFVWNIGTFLAIGVILRYLRMPWWVVFLVLFSPAEYRCLCFGQFGGIMGCLTFAGLMIADRRPVLAGFMIGLVTMKPQPGIIVPVAWLAARAWRAMLAAAVTFVVLAMIAVLLLGPQSWVMYFTKSGPMAARIMQAPFGLSYQLSGVSVYWMMRSLGGWQRVCLRVSGGGRGDCRMFTVSLLADGEGEPYRPDRADLGFVAIRHALRVYRGHGWLLHRRGRAGLGP
jgi:hypothetical protein